MIKWIKKKWCEKFGHDYEIDPAGAIVCARCGHTLAGSRSEILQSLLPGLEQMFGLKYKDTHKEKQ